MVSSIEIWDEGFNTFGSTYISSITVGSHSTNQIYGGTFTPDNLIGYSLKFTDGTYINNGYVITDNGTHLITCLAANFSGLSNGETFNIISTGKELGTVNIPIGTISLPIQTITVHTQHYNEGFFDFFGDGSETGISENHQYRRWYNLYGRTYNQFLNYLSSVSIYEPERTGIIGTLYSDINGSYFIDMLFSSYKVFAEKEGYKGYAETVDLRSNDAKQDFVLTRRYSQDIGQSRCSRLMGSYLARGY